MTSTNPTRFIKQFSRFEQFDGVRSIAINKLDQIIIAEDKQISGFSQDGKFLFKFGSRGYQPGEFNNISAITVNSFGNIIVADTDSGRVQVFSPRGDFIFEFSEQLRNPMGVTVNSLDQIIVCDNSSERVLLFSLDGKFLFDIGDLIDRFENPFDVKTNSRDEIIVIDIEKIQIFSSTGIFLFSFYPPNMTGSIAINSRDEIIVCDYEGESLHVFSTDGNFLFNVGIYPFEGYIEFPEVVAVDSSDNIIVVDLSGIKIFGDIRSLSTNSLYQTIPQTKQNIQITINTGGVFTPYILSPDITVTQLHQILKQLPTKSQFIIEK